MVEEDLKREEIEWLGCALVILVRSPSLRQLPEAIERIVSLYLGICCCAT